MPPYAGDVDEPILPQRPTEERAEVASIEWLFGPAWPGDRLIARIVGDTVHLTDLVGRAATSPDVEARLHRAIAASSAVVDGVWGLQPIVDEDGPTIQQTVFAALDLLELDGDSLLDVPFQERHRLLESVVRDGLGVRVGPLVKQPLGGWLEGWRQAGFSHYLAWHQNARYLPGAQSDAWLRIPIGAAAAPGILRRVIGGGRGTRRIR